MLFRLHFLLHCICFYIISFLFSFLHFILCHMCICHMFNKVLTYLLTYLTIIVIVTLYGVLVLAKSTTADTWHW